MSTWQSSRRGCVILADFFPDALMFAQFLTKISLLDKKILKDASLCINNAFKADTGESGNQCQR